RVGDDGDHRAGLGAAGVVLAADCRAARARREDLMIRNPARTGIVIAGLALATVPLLKLPAFYESFFYLIFYWVVLATSWNILSGYSGYFSFGHGAFFGTGMYATATLTTKAGMPFLWTLPVCGALAALFGVAIGA